MPFHNDRLWAKNKIKERERELANWVDLCSVKKVMVFRRPGRCFKAKSLYASKYASRRLGRLTLKLEA